MTDRPMTTPDPMGGSRESSDVNNDAPSLRGPVESRSRSNCPETRCEDGFEVIVGTVWTIYRCQKCGVEDWL